jgi:dynein heavy chain, axonemal
MEAKAGLQVLKPGDPLEMQRKLENCMTFGVPLLVQNVGEQLDSVLQPLLDRTARTNEVGLSQAASVTG